MPPALPPALPPEVRRHVARYQRKFNLPLSPPEDAASWSKRLLRRWFEDGGTLTLEAAVQEETALESEGKSASYIGQVGDGLPVVPLQPTVDAEGGLLGAVGRGESRVFHELAAQLESPGWALADLGAPFAIWPAVCDEGARLWPSMSPGILERRDGDDLKTTPGFAPSGKPRGDRYIPSSRARSAGEWPALALIDRALAVVGTRLNEALGRTLVVRSDPFFACFPGGGAEYGAHFDGAYDTCKLTTILYANPDWQAESRGELQIYDGGARCWRAVTPSAGRLLLFRADEVLHRVVPCYAPRYALTAWWFVSPRGERQEKDSMVLLQTEFEPGDPRRRAPFRLERRTAPELVSSMAAHWRVNVPSSALTTS